MRNPITLTFILLAGLACQTSSYYSTEEAVAPPDPLVETIAKEVVVTMKNNFPPGKTRIHFPHKKERLALVIEDKLRKSGYAVVVNSKEVAKDDLRLAYKLDTLGSESVFLRLVAGEGFQFNRFYQREKDGTFTAAGPILLRKG